MDVPGHDSDISQVAAAIAEPERTRMLCALMDGHARTSTELAVIAGVGTSTASAHLARLKEQGLVKLQVQGRHRYYSLADGHVARAIEALMVVSNITMPQFVSTAPDRLQFARTCYDHMAGTLAVRLHDFLIESAWLVTASPNDGVYQLTLDGERALAGLGMNIDALRAQRRRFACGCLDWSMRSPHLAGTLGAAFLQMSIARNWVVQDLDSRALGLTPKGRKELATRFGISF